MIVSKQKVGEWENQPWALAKVVAKRRKFPFKWTLSLSLFSQSQNVAHCAHAASVSDYVHVVWLHFTDALLRCDDLKLIESEIKKRELEKLEKCFWDNKTTVIKIFSFMLQSYRWVSSMGEIAGSLSIEHWNMTNFHPSGIFIVCVNSLDWLFAVNSAL